jgi:hypothetical protein
MMVTSLWNFPFTDTRVNIVCIPVPFSSFIYIYKLSLYYSSHIYRKNGSLHGHEYVQNHLNYVFRMSEISSAKYKPVFILRTFGSFSHLTKV